MLKYNKAERDNAYACPSLSFYESIEFTTRTTIAVSVTTMAAGSVGQLYMIAPPQAPLITDTLTVFIIFSP